MKNSGSERQSGGFRRTASLAAAIFASSALAIAQTRLGHPLPPPTPVPSRPIPRLIQPTGVPVYPIPNQTLINGAAASPLFQTVPVAPNIFMLVGSGANMLVQVGADGVLVVDSKYEEVAPRVDQEIRRLSDKPILWLINTSLNEDHLSGNQALLRLGPRDPQQIPHVVAQQNLLNRLKNVPSKAEEAGTIKDAYSGASKDFTFNGESVSVYAAPAASTDGDSIVFLRNSNVLATGDIFIPEHYPIIDVENGGSVQGVIQALNHVLELSASAKNSSRATQIIPGHGPLSEAGEVQDYRDMLIILRDRIQDAIRKGHSFTEIRFEGLTREYDTRYGAVTGQWATDKFVEAVYNSLKASGR